MKFHKLRRFQTKIGLMLAIFLGFILVCQTTYAMNAFCRASDEVHRISFYICCLLSLGAFGVLIYSILKLRYASEKVRQHFHRHLFTEIVWTLIPFIILIALVTPAVKQLMQM